MSIDLFSSNRGWWFFLAAADEAAGEGAGVVAAFKDHSAGFDCAFVALDSSNQSATPGGEIKDGFGAEKAQALEINDVDVGNFPFLP